MKVICLLLAAIPACAQVSVRYSPEPMAVPAAVLANAKQMGRWQVDLCNDGLNPVMLPIQRVMMAAGPISLIDPADALLVLTANVRRSPSSRIVTILRYAGAGVSIGLAVASRANVAWSAGIGVASSVLPDVITVAQGAVPSAVPLVSTVKWPLLLASGECATDHMFAAKMRNPKPLTTVILK